MKQDITTLLVGKNRIGICRLQSVLEEVYQEYGEGQESVIKHELVRRLEAFNYIPSGARELYAEAFWKAYQGFLGKRVEEEPQVLTIRILGQGCARCDRLEQEVYKVLSELDVAADVQHVRDLKEITAYGVPITPALVINGEVKSAGTLPPYPRLKQWLECYRTR